MTPYASRRRGRNRPLEVMKIGGVIITLAGCVAIIVTALVVITHFVVKYW